MRFFIATILVFTLLPYHKLAGQVLIVDSAADTIVLQRQTSDSLLATQRFNEYILDMISSGFVFLRTEYRQADDRKYILIVDKGRQLDWKSLQVLDSDDSSLYEIQSVRELRQLIKNRANNGYPFASVTPGSIEIKGDEVVARWHLSNGPKIEFDTATVIPSQPVNSSYLQQALNIPIGKPYSEKDFKRIPKRINQVPFFRLKGQPDLSFQEGKATVYLPLEPVAANSFEGVLGLLPNQSVDGSTLVTGYLDLDLKNILRSGKQVKLNWQRFDEQSQNLDLSYHHPFLGNSPISVTANFSLIRQDTTFLNRQIEVEGSLFLGANNSLGFGYRNENSQVLGRQGDFNTMPYLLNSYHIFYRNTSSAQVTAGRQLHYSIMGSAGTRVLEENRQDTSDVSDLNLFFTGLLSNQWTLAGQLALFSQIRGSLLYNQQLFRNQLLRLGGFQTFRGFNENQFFLSRYILHNLEFRYFFEKSSYLFFLTDTGYLESISDFNLPDPLHYSLGLGLTINSSNGIFSIIFAAGNVAGQSLSVNDTKVHFGYRSTF